MTIQLQPVHTPEAIARLAVLADTVWHEFFVSILSPEQIDYMVDRFQSETALTDQITRQGYSYYFLEADGIPVGYTGIVATEGKLFLSKLYLEKNSRGKGYASQAFEQIEAIARERALSAVWLTVNRHNEHAIAVYRKRGFKVVRTQVADIGSGFVMDDYVMEKSLTE